MASEQAGDMAGCICEHGCRNCGLPYSRMSDCPAWDRSMCPVGREHNPACVIHGEPPTPSPAPTAPPQEQAGVES